MSLINRYLFFSLIALFASAFLFVAHGSAKSIFVKNNIERVHFNPEISNPYVEYGSNGEMLVNLRLWGDDIAPVKRPPVNLVLVIDESGSMNDRGKMTYAKQAAKDLVSKLNSYDRVGIVTYSDYSNLLLPLQRLNNKQKVKRLIDSIYPTNSTNLSSGLIEGINQLKFMERDGYVNKIILLSDGLANRGITNIHSLSRIASRAAENGSYITTMGLGINYDEDLMMSLAEYGAGNYYFIESPNQIAHIFNKEFGQMLSTIAKDVELECDLAPNVELMDLYGYKYKVEGDKVVLNLGNFFAGQERDIKMRLKIPTDKKGSKELMTASLKYRDSNDNKFREKASSVNYKVTGDRIKVEKSENKEVLAGMESVRAAKGLDEATRDYEKGDKKGALSKIKDALGRVRSLNRTPYRSSETVEQEKVLEEAFDDLSVSSPAPDSSAGKKIIKRYKLESRNQQK